MTNDRNNVSKSPGYFGVINFSLKVTIFIVILIVVGGLIFSYVYFDAQKDLVKFIASVLGGGAAVYVAYYAGLSLNLKIEQDKKVESFRIIDKLNGQEFVGVRHIIEKTTKKRKAISDQALYAMINKNKEAYDSAKMLLGLLEATSIAIQEDYVDENVLYKFLASIVSKNWEDLRGYIEQYRERSKRTTLWKEFQKLHEAWSKKERLSDNKPLPDLLDS